MKRKYPAGMFWGFVLSNFFFRFFYLFAIGAILCIVGIWVRICLWIGLAVLALDAVISIIDQLRLRKVAIEESDNAEFNELMDAFLGPDGLDATREIVEGKINDTPPEKSEDEDEQK